MQVWRYDQKLGDWQQDGATLVGHTDWVRDVAWAPNLGLPKTVIASAGQDGKVLIWMESRDVPGQWSPALLHDFKVQLYIPGNCLPHSASLWDQVDSSSQTSVTVSQANRCTCTRCRL